MPVYDNKKDAERYRWLRKNFDAIEFRHKRMDNCLRVVNGTKPDLLDTVIDELRKTLASNAKLRGATDD